jgi:hypothetical protein
VQSVLLSKEVDAVEVTNQAHETSVQCVVICQESSVSIGTITGKQPDRMYCNVSGLSQKRSQVHFDIFILTYTLEYIVVLSPVVVITKVCCRKLVSSLDLVFINVLCNIDVSRSDYIVSNDRIISE